MTDIASFRQLNTSEKFSPFINHRNGFLGRRALKKIMEHHNVYPTRAQGKAVSYIREFDLDFKESPQYAERDMRFVGEYFMNLTQVLIFVGLHNMYYQAIDLVHF